MPVAGFGTIFALRSSSGGGLLEVEYVRVLMKRAYRGHIGAWIAGTSAGGGPDSRCWCPNVVDGRAAGLPGARAGGVRLGEWQLRAVGFGTRVGKPGFLAGIDGPVVNLQFVADVLWWVQSFPASGTPYQPRDRLEPAARIPPQSPLQIAREWWP